MPRPLSTRERMLVTTMGLPARTVAISLNCSVHEVLELRDQLRRRGASPDFPHRHHGVLQQLTLGEPCDSDSAPSSSTG